MKCTLSNVYRHSPPNTSIANYTVGNDPDIGKKWSLLSISRNFVGNFLVYVLRKTALKNIGISRATSQFLKSICRNCHFYREHDSFFGKQFIQLAFMQLV